MIIATVGFFVAFFVMLVTPNSNFVHTINSFSAPYTHTSDTYGATIAAGAKAGLLYPSAHGYSFKATLGAMAVGTSLFMFYYWGIFMAGEMKGAARRSRQLTTMMGAGYVQGLVVIIAAFVFIHTAGYNFFAAANSGDYGVPVSPYYNFFASVVSGSPFLSIVMSLSFLGFLFPGLYINSSMVQRSLFAWSFDGIVPRRLSSVNERTRTPVVAIATVAVLGTGAAAYLIYGSNIAAILSVTAIMLVPPALVAGLAGLLLPSRHPHLRERTRRRRIGELPVLRVASIGCLLITTAWCAAYLYFHTQFGVKGWATFPLVLIGCGVVAVL